MRHFEPGEPVTVLFRGKYDGYDPESGCHKLRGSYVDPDGSGHVEWRIEAHWSADLEADASLWKKAQISALRDAADWLQAADPTAFWIAAANLRSHASWLEQAGMPVITDSHYHH